MNENHHCRMLRAWQGKGRWFYSYLPFNRIKGWTFSGIYARYV